MFGSHSHGHGHGHEHSHSKDSSHSEEDGNENTASINHGQSAKENVCLEHNILFPNRLISNRICTVPTYLLH